MGIFSTKNKAGQRIVNVEMFDGIKEIPKGFAVSITLDSDAGRVAIQAKFAKTPPVYLTLSQITNVAVVSEKEVVEKSKSVIGRAAVGGLLLGPLGAIVGGVSGVGDKKSTQTQNFLVINYTPSDGGETKVLSFKITPSTLGWFEFVKELRELSNTEPRREAISL